MERHSEDVGFLRIKREGSALANVDFTKPTTVGDALREIADALSKESDDSAKKTALFLKSASVGFEAAIADFVRHEYSPKDATFAATNALAQMLAFLVGTLARQNENDGEIVAQKIATVAAGFCEVFCPMTAQLSGSGIEISNKFALLANKDEFDEKVDALKKKHGNGKKAS